MDMTFWKKLPLLLSQGMNQNGNSTLNWVLSNFLPLERRQLISLRREGFIHTKAPRAANNNPITSSFRVPHIIVTCSKISIKKEQFYIGLLRKELSFCPVGNLLAGQRGPFHLKHLRFHLFAHVILHLIAPN